MQSVYASQYKRLCCPVEVCGRSVVQQVGSTWKRSEVKSLFSEALKVRAAGYWPVAGLSSSLSTCSSSSTHSPGCTSPTAVKCLRYRDMAEGHTQDDSPPHLCCGAQKKKKNENLMNHFHFNISETLQMMLKCAAYREFLCGLKAKEFKTGDLFWSFSPYGNISSH